MKPCAFAGQALSEHIKGCLAVLEDFLKGNGSYPEVVSRRLKAASGKYVKPDKVEEMIRLAVLFHDVGKAYNSYQKAFNSDCSSYRKFGFQHHEVLSAAMCYKFLTDNSEEWSTMTKTLVVTSILNHHHAFRNLFKEITKRSGNIEEEVHSVVRGGFCEGDLPSLFNNYNVTLRDVILNGKDVNSFFSYLKGLGKRSGNIDVWLKLYVLVMNPLLIADNLDAMRRGGEINASRKAFIYELMEVVYC